MLGRPPKFVTSPSGYTSRFTDRETLEIFEMVYCGKVNKGIVERLQKLGVNAVGLSGLDGRIFEGKHKDKVRSVENGKTKVLRGDHTGTVEKVNTALLELLLENHYLPVLTPPGSSFQGIAVNVDGGPCCRRRRGWPFKLRHCCCFPTYPDSCVTSLTRLL